MIRYLNHLHSDIRQSIELSKTLSDLGTNSSPFDSDELSRPFDNQLVGLSQVLGITADSFPPASFLDDAQTSALLLDIEMLWRSWKLTWDMPLGLSPKQQYAAMLHSMQNEVVSWHPQRGGFVKICQYETGSFCPHGDSGYCHCRSVNEAAKLDIEIWEEHVRSQGIDPYSELSAEAEAAFEAENRKRDLRKRNEEDWLELRLLDNLMEPDENSERRSDFRPEYGLDWLDYLLWGNDEQAPMHTTDSTGNEHDGLDDPLEDLLSEEY